MLSVDIKTYTEQHRTFPLVVVRLYVSAHEEHWLSALLSSAYHMRDEVSDGWKHFKPMKTIWCKFDLLYPPANTGIVLFLRFLFLFFHPEMHLILYPPCRSLQTGHCCDARLALGYSCNLHPPKLHQLLSQDELRDQVHYNHLQPWVVLSWPILQVFDAFVFLFFNVQWCQTIFCVRHFYVCVCVCAWVYVYKVYQQKTFELSLSFILFTFHRNEFPQ